MKTPLSIAPSLVLAAALSFSANVAPAFAESSLMVPQGPYLSSCTDAKRVGSWLRANCTTNNGATKKTEIKYENCMSPIENHDGTLWCRTRLA